MPMFLSGNAVRQGKAVVLCRFFIQAVEGNGTCFVAVGGVEGEKEAVVEGVRVGETDAKTGAKKVGGV